MFLTRTIVRGVLISAAKSKFSTSSATVLSEESQNFWGKWLDTGKLDRSGIDAFIRGETTNNFSWENLTDMFSNWRKKEITMDPKPDSYVSMSDNGKITVQCAVLFRLFNEFIKNDEFYLLENIEEKLVEELKLEKIDKLIEVLRTDPKEKEHILKEFESTFSKESKLIIQDLPKDGLKSTEFSPDHFALIARLFILTKQHRLAAESIWGLVALSTKEYGNKRGIKLNHHGSIKSFVREVKKFDKEGDFLIKFETVENAHQDGFYEDKFDAKELQNRLEAGLEFTKILHSIVLPDQKVEELKERFNQDPIEAFFEAFDQADSETRDAVSREIGKLDNKKLKAYCDVYTKLGKSRLNEVRDELKKRGE